MTIEYTKSDILNISKQYTDNPNKKDLLLFVGHAHSGHSIIGSILDCHQSIVLANEVNIVKSISEYRLSKHQIEAILIHESQRPKNAKWLNSAYQYDIEYSHQNNYIFPPKVLGDKKAGGTTRIIRNHPWLLDYLLHLYGNRLKFIFVKRNPLDVVASYSHYMKQPISQFHVNRYKENYETAMLVNDIVPENQFYCVKQELFVKSPTTYTKEILKFLNLENIEDNPDIDSWCKIVRNDIKGKSQSIKIPENLSKQLKCYI